MPGWAECSESVEEALDRLDRESKAKKAALLAKREQEKVEMAKEKEPKVISNPLIDAMKAEDMDKCRKLYPERGGDEYKPSWWSIMFKGEGREGLDKIKCERNVYSVLRESHIVRVLLDALKSSGCPVDIRRHISCEVCSPAVTGGYDPFFNQVVICQNTARYKGMIQGSLTHELIHMFDYCRHKMDLTSVRHLACTEIRAANLTHCSFLSAWSGGSASPFNVKARHQECVKSRAVDSVVSVRDISREDALAVVEEVFTKCYNDLEPIGRRIRRSSDDMRKAYKERTIYGYV